MRHTITAVSKAIARTARKESKTLKTMGLLLVKRFPRIMAYTLAIFVLMSLMDRAYYHFAPDEWFIKYEQAKVANAREGEDVPFTVCREARGDYSFEGFREIYMIPQGGEEGQRKVVKVTSVENSIRRDESCRNFFISTDEYYHRPGRYMIAAYLKFPLKYGEVADASFSSNIYTIYANPNDTLENKLLKLQDNVKTLQKALNQIRVDNGLDPIDYPQLPGEVNKKPSSNVPSGANPEPTIPGNPEPVQPSPEPEPEPTPEPEESGLLACVQRELLLGILRCL